MKTTALVLAVLCAYLLLWVIALDKAGRETAADRDLWRNRAIGMRAMAAQCIVHDRKVVEALNRCKKGLDL